MSTLLEAELSKRITFLRTLVSSRKRSVTMSPEGSIRGTQKGNSFQYFLRLDGDRSNGIYLPKSRIELIRGLGQKSYDKKVIRSAETELSLLESLYDLHQSDTNPPVEQIFEKLPPWHQAIVTHRAASPDVKFIRSWKNKKYNSLSNYKKDENLLTKQGEYVRSKSELYIANALYDQGIPYHYEMPLLLDPNTLVYPDFTILDIRTLIEIYWEHLGMLDDPEYFRKNYFKIKHYEQHGIFLGSRLIISYELKDDVMNTRLIDEKIRHYFLCG